MTQDCVAATACRCKEGGHHCRTRHCARKAESDAPEYVYVVTGAAIHVMMTQTVIDITVLNRTITFGDGAQAIARQSVIIMCITEFY